MEHKIKSWGFVYRWFFFQIVSNDWIKVWIIGNIILDKIKIAIDAETNTIYYNV